MTQEQDIVDRLLEKAAASLSLYRQLYEEAAQTIAALRAERDEQKRDACKWFSEALEQKQRAEAAEAKVKELEAEISNLDAELDHWSQLAVDDLGKNPPTSWKEIANTAIRERDELRKALVPFANAIVGLQTVWDDDLTLGFSNPLTQRVTVGDFRRARAASSNREGGEE